MEFKDIHSTSVGPIGLWSKACFLPISKRSRTKLGDDLVQVRSLPQGFPEGSLMTRHLHFRVPCLEVMASTTDHPLNAGHTFQNQECHHPYPFSSLSNHAGSSSTTWKHRRHQHGIAPFKRFCKYISYIYIINVCVCVTVCVCAVAILQLLIC